MPEHSDDILCVDECLLPWMERVSHDGWGSLGRHHVEWIVAQIPEDRILGAHALTDPGHVPSLFDLCVRGTVPMGIVRALLGQRLAFIPHGRLRTYVGPDAEAPAEPIQCAQTTVRHIATVQKTIFRWPRWWVAACGCRPEATEDRCDLGGDCPRACLREISERDALRMMAFCWTFQVEACYLTAIHDVHDPAVHPREWDERDWRFMTGDGHVSLLWMGSETTKCLWNNLIPGWRARYREMARATHPWEPRILVAHSGTPRRSSTVASVVGDSLFGMCALYQKARSAQ